ncbi:MAG: class II aldolase/adducin family protein [Chloroflexi bacterium]|nr:class II aldolase/adducin family protein [Chloroflexota bacterium]
MEQSEVVQQLKEKVALSCKILGKLGLADYLGHVSARVPGTDLVVVKPRHSPKITSFAAMTAREMAVVNLDGKHIDGDYPPPSEVQLHLQVLKARPDVGSVVHTHQRMATAFGIAGREILPVLHLEAGVVAKGLPVYPSPDLIITVEQGAEVARALGQSTACLLQGHGVVVVGEIVEEATVNTIHLENLAEMNYRVAQLGTAKVISPESIAKNMVEKQPIWGRWAHYCSLLEE